MDHPAGNTLFGCSNCGSNEEAILDSANGEYVCPSCGCVREKVIYEGKDWRDFENDENVGKESRSHAEEVDADFPTLGTHISASNFGSNVASAASRSLSKVTRMAAQDDKVSKHLKEGFDKINDLGERLTLPNRVKQTAKEIFRKFETTNQENSSKGYRKDSFFIAVLLVACRIEHAGGRTVKTVSAQTNVAQSEIKKFYKKIIKDPDLISLDGTAKRKQTAAEQAKEHVEVYCNRLELAYSTARVAKEVAEVCTDLLEGKQPSSIAAASVLFVLNRKGISYNFQLVANTASISPNTLRNVYRQLANSAHKLPLHLFDLNNAGK